jgi:serine/threonine protein kinase
VGESRLVVGRYRLDQPIGRGGMGEVWSALDVRLDRKVAVKLLRPNGLPAGVEHEALVSRFQREAMLTAKLDHPGVPAVYDTGATDDEFFLVMELIEGSDLAEFQAGYEPVETEWTAAIGAQIASVLGAAHAVNLVHRDLKPRNVMITRQGRVKVLDFGIASLLDPDLTRITATALSLGTPAYMAPEQAMHGVVSPASDLYSLGCVLYELITGKPVFTASTALALMHRHHSEAPAPVRVLRPDTAPELAVLVEQLLAKEPRARPANALEVYDRLAQLLPADRTQPVRDLPMDPTRPFRDPHATPTPRPDLGTTAVAPVPGPPPYTPPSPTAMWPPQHRPRFAERALLTVAVCYGASLLVGVILLATARPVSIQAVLFDLVVTVAVSIVWLRMRRRRLAGLPN